ncbi:MAG: signal recognition particle-docking protein FtsY [Thermoplasmataceae archaeon]
MFKGLRGKFSGLFGGKNEEEVRGSEFIQNVYEALLESDVSLEAAERISSVLSRKIPDQKKRLPTESFKTYLYDTIMEFLNAVRSNTWDMLQGESPFKVLFLGINGTGKTTTIAKVAKFLVERNRRVVIAASDTFRAGAIDQISYQGERVGVKVIKHQPGSDPSAVAYDAIEHAKSRGIDYVLIDTAGRMQNNINLREEMKKIKRVTSPNLTILVIDSMAANDVMEQSKTFSKEIGFDAIIVTKLDTDARGGSILTIASELKKPIMFVGTGQNPEDLIEFSPEWMIKKILPEDLQFSS